MNNTTLLQLAGFDPNEIKRQQRLAGIGAITSALASIVGSLNRRRGLELGAGYLEQAKNYAEQIPQIKKESLASLLTLMKLMQPTEPPSSIKELMYYEKMSPEERKLFGQLKSLGQVGDPYAPVILPFLSEMIGKIKSSYLGGQPSIGGQPSQSSLNNPFTGIGLGTTQPSQQFKLIPIEPSQQFKLIPIE